MTLNELFDIYIEDVDMINQVTTTDSIKYRYKSHLKPVFGNIELKQLIQSPLRSFKRIWLKVSMEVEVVMYFRCHILI